MKVLLKWDNTIWTVLKINEFGKYIIKSKDGEITKAAKNEIIIINE